MACYRTDCVEKPLSKLFEKLGHLVGSHPVWFFVIPLLLSAALGGGLYFLKDCEDNNVENQFTPINGPSKQARLFVKERFPKNDSMFSSQRLYDEGNYAVMILSSVEGNILTKTAFEEILRLDKKVNSFSVKHNQMQISFEDVCAKVNENCVPNSILDITENNAEKIEKLFLSFPMFIWKDQAVFLGSAIGGVEEKGGIIQQAHAIRLFYFLQDEDGAVQWLQDFLKILSNETLSGGVKVCRQNY